MRLEDLLIELEQAMGLPNLELNQEGICHLFLNKTALVSLERSPNKPGFYLYSTVGVVPKHLEASFCLEALSGNLFGRQTGGASLGYLPPSSTLILFEYMPEAGLSLATFRQRLEEFLAYLKMWHGKLSAMVHEPEGRIQSRFTAHKANRQLFFA